MPENYATMELDPRVKNFKRNLQIGGVAVVAAGASALVFVAGASLAIAGVAAVAGIAVVNFIPVFARWAALRKQKALTQLAEVYSEETIREDERQEGDRIKILEEQYRVNRSELEGAQEELRAQKATATDEECAMLDTHVSQLQSIIDNAEEVLRQRKVDFEELKRVNKLYIAFGRSAAAMERSTAAVRNTEQFQQVETARASIKARMRQQMAGKTIEAMNAQIEQKPNIQHAVQIGHSKPLVVPTHVKEVKDALPNRR